jgi:hypothetical protein
LRRENKRKRKRQERDKENILRKIHTIAVKELRHWVPVVPHVEPFADSKCSRTDLVPSHGAVFGP